MPGVPSRPALQACSALVLAFGLMLGCTEGSAPDDDLQAIHPPEIARIVPVGEALAGAYVPTLDPSTMNGAEIRKALGEGPRCEFRYTTSGRPVLAVRMEPDGTPLAAVVKLNGQLVPLHPAPVDAGAASTQRLLVVSGPVRIGVQPDPREEAKMRAGIERREATMIFEVGQRLRAGYRGYLDCVVETRTQALGQ